MSKSKFLGLLDAMKGKEAASDTLSESKDTPPKRNQPKGKRVNPDYVQVKVYLKKSTHLALKRAALEKDQEISELIEILVSKYLSTQVPE